MIEFHGVPLQQIGEGGQELVSDQDSLEVIAQCLEQITAHYERNQDSRAVFTYAYTILTRRLAKQLETADFADAQWVLSLAKAFAALYLEAIDSYDRGKASRAWGTVFDAICRQPSSVLEDLVYPLYAHIVHDLPIALESVHLSGQDGSHIRDFHLVNDILGEAIRPIMDKVSKRYSPIIRWLDHLGEQYGQLLTNYGIRMSRGLAWYNAIRLEDPESREEAMETIAKSPAIFIEQVRHPPIWSLRIIFRIGRFIVARCRRWPSDNLSINTDAIYN